MRAFSGVISLARISRACSTPTLRALRSLRTAHRCFPTPLSLIGSDRIEAVIIASPDATHAELTLPCLAAGKPVLCEKPLASSATDALRVVEAEVALNRRLIQVGYMRRFDPGYQAMKRIKDEGGVGATVLLHNVHRNARAPEWFTGAMSVTNSFVHEIDISRWLTGSR